VRARIRQEAPRRGAFLFFALALAVQGLALAAPPAATERAVVASVVDGDTVILADGRHVRLVGINTPERGRDGAPHEPFYAQARALLERQVSGQRVSLVAGAERVDRHGRTLAHLLLPDGRNVQEGLLEQGLAFAVAIPPNVQFLEPYIAAERRARARRAGVWAHPYYAPRPAAELDRGDAGFRLVRGRVQRVGESRRYVYLDLSRDVSLMIPRDAWDRSFPGRPQAWRGRDLIARGWLSDQGGKLRMKVYHPAMIERVGQ
jgi:endonuclease YncB( thermonuclease family)